jgi:molybdopterin molybdotransferase
MELAHPVGGWVEADLRAALGRVLAQAVISGLDVPPHTNSAMDGYALRASDLHPGAEARLQVIGKSYAGAPFSGAVGPGEAVRIMTGALLPEGADTVVMQELVERSGDTVRVAGSHPQGDNVRHAGEDMKRGEQVLGPGRRLQAADLGLLASLGIARVRVTRALRVAYFSTGDELRSVGEPLEKGQIYDSNRYTLHGMLAQPGIEALDLGVVADDRDAVRTAFREAAEMADVVITSGGVSVGEADHVKHTLNELGRVELWRIAMKPGKPLAVGRLGQALFFGLPGNPVSVMATFYQLVQPALRQMLGDSPAEPLRLRLRTLVALRKAPGRTDFQRGRLVRDEQGELAVTTTGLQGSHVLTSMSRADCFIVLSAEAGDVAAGDWVEVEPLAGLI